MMKRLAHYAIVARCRRTNVSCDVSNNTRFRAAPVSPYGLMPVAPAVADDCSKGVSTLASQVARVAPLTHPTVFAIHAPSRRRCSVGNGFTVNAGRATNGWRMDTGTFGSVRRVAVRTAGAAWIVEAEATLIGGDVLVAIWGGGRPHIGAVAAASSRSSLADPAKTSATSSVLTYPGHKEDIVVKMAAEALSAALGTNVVVTAGLHWDDLPPGAVDR